MSRREARRSPEQSVRSRRRALTLGLAVPAVVSMGALPAFASHSADLDDTGHDLDVLESDTLSLDYEFAGAEELDYNPFAEAEAEETVVDAPIDDASDTVVDPVATSEDTSDGEDEESPEEQP